MGIGGSCSPDDFTEGDEEEKKSSIVEDTGDKDGEEFPSVIYPRTLSDTSQPYCCCCLRRRKSFTRMESFAGKISLEAENHRKRSRSLEIGAAVNVRNYCSGTVRFNGETHFAPGVFIGVELDQPFGKHDGFYDGRRYFHAQPNTGVFVRPGRLDNAGDDPLKQQTSTFSLSLSGGLVTVNTSVKENLKDDLQIIRYRPTRLSPEYKKENREVSPSTLEDKIFSLQETDDKASKLDLLFQLLEKEYLQFFPNHRRKASHHRARSRRKGHSRSVRTTEQLATSRDRGSAGLQSSAKSLSSVGSTVISLEQNSASNLESRGHANLTSNSALSVPSDAGVLPIDNLKTPSPAAPCSFESFDNQNSFSRLALRNAPSKLSMDASTIQDQESDDYSDYSGDDVGQVDLLMQDLEHERLMVKRKEERVRELEEELRGYDKELKEKTKALTRQSKQIDRLRRRCDELAAGRDEAVADAEGWRFEVLYGRGEQPMMKFDP